MRRRPRGPRCRAMPTPPVLLPERQRPLVQRQQLRMAARIHQRADLHPSAAPACAGDTAGACLDVSSWNLPRRAGPGCPADTAQTTADDARVQQHADADLRGHAAGVQRHCANLQYRHRADLQHDQANLQSSRPRCATSLPRRCNVRRGSCINVLVPAGCNLLPDPESVNCALISNAARSAASPAPIAPTTRGLHRLGKCSVNTAPPARPPMPRPTARLRRHLQFQWHACTVDRRNARISRSAAAPGADAQSLPIARTRRAPALTAADCTASGTCPATNRCGGTAAGAACTTSPNNCTCRRQMQLQTGTSCTSNANCPTVAGTCSVSGTALHFEANCPATGTGTCSMLRRACTAQRSNCPTVPGTCNAIRTTRDGLHRSTRNCTTKSRYCSNQPTKTCTANKPVHARRHLQRHLGQRRRRLHDTTATCTIKPGTCDANAVNAGASLHAGLELHARRPASAASPAQLAPPTPTASTVSPPSSRSAARRRQRCRCHDAVRRRQRRGSHLPPQQQGLRRRDRRAQQLSRRDLQCRRSPAAPAPRPAWRHARYEMVPRHYWKTSVEWCDKAMPPPATNGRALARRPAAPASRSRTRRTSTRASTNSAPIRAPTTSRLRRSSAWTSNRQRRPPSFTHTWKDSQGNPNGRSRTFDGATPTCRK